MIYITGDCHSRFKKFSTAAFPEQNDLHMTKDDIVIVCGDFGAVWDARPSSEEAHWLDWMDTVKPYTTVFVDGNHENFDRLNSEFEVVDFYGGKAHKLRESVYHLMRGEVFEFEGRRFFAFGGAASHDISDGILRREDYTSDRAFRIAEKQWKRRGLEFRIEHRSWWAQELPNDAEYANAERNLARVGYQVDYVVTHCAPQSVASVIDPEMKADRLTEYFDDLAKRLTFRNWFFGHYHDDRKVNDRYILLYDQMVRIL